VTDHIALIRERLSKAEIRATRAEKAWESAKNEVADLLTTLRVLGEVTGESPPPVTANASAAVAERQKLIASLLKVGEAAASSPSDIFEMYKMFASEDISIDTFRTTIWRMKGHPFQVGDDLWLIMGDSGAYWKEPGTFETRARWEASQPNPFARTVIPMPMPNPPAPDWEDDNDPPF
jgi:hypothetical protein